MNWVGLENEIRTMGGKHTLGGKQAVEKRKARPEGVLDPKINLHMII